MSSFQVWVKLTNECPWRTMRSGIEIPQDPPISIPDSRIICVYGYAMIFCGFWECNSGIFYHHALTSWAISSVSKYHIFFSLLIWHVLFFSCTLCSDCNFPSSTPSSPSHHILLSPRSTCLYFPSKNFQKLKLKQKKEKKTWLSIKHAYRATIRLDKTLKPYKT